MSSVKTRKPTFKPMAECPMCERVETVKSIDGDTATLVKHKRGYYYSTCLNVTVPVSAIGAWIKSEIARRDEIMAGTNARMEEEKERHSRAMAGIAEDFARARDSVEALRKMALKYPVPATTDATDTTKAE